MISYIKGEISVLTEDMAVVETGGIGYSIKITPQTAGALSSAGGQVKLHTYLYVREDALDLYGFMNRDDLEFFRLLIGVSGIGPKGALGILSGMSSDELRFAILAGDVKAISRAPGVGAKTAQRLILDLKDKVSLEDVLEKGPGDMGGGTMDISGAADEASQALIALGYSPSESLRAVRAAHVEEGMEADDILRAALKKIH